MGADRSNAQAVDQDGMPHRRAMCRGGGGLHMTPMIDVVFLLLIFFIMSTEFRSIEGLLPTNLPGDGPIDFETRIVVESDPVGSGPFTARMHTPDLGADARSPAHLTELLRGMGARFGGAYRTRTAVVIQAGRDVVYNDVILVYDAVLAARMENIVFALGDA